MDMSGNGRCTCGKELTGTGGSFGGVMATTWRECECGIKALFYTVGKDYEVCVQTRHKDDKKNKEEEKEKLLSLFKLAGIKVACHWNIENGYGGDAADWLLVRTEIGLIEIGWRKRVISIDWSDTGIQYFIEDDVTKNEHSCHAWNYENAIKYLKGLKNYKVEAPNEI